MDGRCQEKTVAFAKDLFGGEYVDTITEPGINGLLADGAHYGAASEELRMSLKDWVRAKAAISANGHGSKSILITGHLQCAGNPVSRDEHVAHLKEAADLVRSWGLFDDIRTAQFGDDWELALVEA